MKFGVREIANVVFKAKNLQKIGPYTFQKGQPVFYMDTAKTSTLEGAATTVYATGGRGNTRLIAWEGEKTLTFTVEDALLSPISFAMLSGAGLIKPADDSASLIHFHQTSAAIAATTTTVTEDSTTATVEIDLTDALESGEEICSTAPIYIMEVDNGGDITGKITEGWNVVDSPETSKGKKLSITLTKKTEGTGDEKETGAQFVARVKSYTGSVMVDYYVIKKASTVSELQIDMQHFAGYYYVEADTLFRRQSDGKDLPANITFPNVKIQSNFTFSMASTGDPSTFTFTMDAFPGYTYFDRTKKVLCAIQVVDDATEDSETAKTIFPHPTGFNIDESIKDSVDGTYTGTGTKTETDDAQG